MMFQTTNIHIRPAPGKRVRKPDGTLLAEAGEVMPRASHWIRAIEAGDVYEVPAAPPTPEPEPPTNPALEPEREIVLPTPRKGAK